VRWSVLEKEAQGRQCTLEGLGRPSPRFQGSFSSWPAVGYSLALASSRSASNCGRSQSFTKWFPDSQVTMTPVPKLPKLVLLPACLGHIGITTFLPFDSAHVQVNRESLKNFLLGTG
jgi:hypothetical protein